MLTLRIFLSYLLDVIWIGVVVVSIGMTVLMAVVAGMFVFLVLFCLYCVHLCRKYVKKLELDAEKSNVTTTRVGGIVIHPKKDTTDDRNN